MTWENLRSGPYRKYHALINQRASEWPGNEDPELYRRVGGTFGTTLFKGELTSEEETDIKNFVAFVAKRIGAGAISSRAYHDEVAQGNVNVALEEWAPQDSMLHDVMHSLIAYMRTGRKSLVPAYALVESKGDEYKDDLALFEECYILLFGDFYKEELFKGIDENEDPVLRAIEKWEERMTSTYEFNDPDFLVGSPGTELEFAL